MIRIALLAALLAVTLIATGAQERIGRALYEAGAPALAGLLLTDPAWKGATLYERGRYAEAAAAFEAASFPAQLYDLGLALARAGKLTEAKEAFEAALERDPNDEDARFNLALLENLEAKRRAEARGATSGFASAAGTENKRSGKMESDQDNAVDSVGEGASGDRDSGKEAKGATGKAPKTGEAPQTGSGDSGRARGSIGAGAGASRSGDAYMNVSTPPVQLAHRLEVAERKVIAASRRWLETLPDDPGVYLKRRIAHERAVRKENGAAAPEIADSW